MSFLLCADFAIFPVNTQLGPAFTLAGMDFQNAAGAALVSFVNEAAGERGLQFPHDGLDIDLPVPVPWARLRIGQFAGSNPVEGLNPAGVEASRFATTAEASRDGRVGEFLTPHRVLTDAVQVRATDRDFDYAIDLRV
jgi:hypothetical protein